MADLHINDRHEVHEPQDEEQDEAEHGEALHGEVQQSHGGQRGLGTGWGSHRLGTNSTSCPASVWDQSEECSERPTLSATSSACSGE